MNTFDYVLEATQNSMKANIQASTTESARLGLLAEEAFELGQSALKLQRVLGGIKTECPEEKAREDLYKEAADVYNAIALLGLDMTKIRKYQNAKLKKLNDRY